MVKIATVGLKTEGSSSVPTLTIMEPGRFGLWVPSEVPQWLQKKRVTGLSKSLRLKVAGSPRVKRKPSKGSTIATLGLPPEMYWHSRQWHCSDICGGPVAP